MLAICRRFGCLPSAALAEGAEILRLLRVEYHGVRREEVAP